MKLLVLAALFAVVASRTVKEDFSLWIVGKEYLYEIESRSWSSFDVSDKVGSTFKAQFIVKVKGPGHLQAKLENPQRAQFHTQFEHGSLPSDLKYEPFTGIDQVFEIFISNSRIKEMTVPASLSIPHENLLKGLVSAIQVDLTSDEIVSDFPNSLSDDGFQAIFKKYEADVTGECETLYTVLPTSAVWRSQVPNFPNIEDPIEITKSKNYGSCLVRAVYDRGVPEGAVWQGIADESEESQFIRHTSDAHLFIGKQGTIYKSEIASNVFVNPMVFGKQKSHVYSYVKFILSSIKDNGSNWEMPEKTRSIKSLLYVGIDTPYIVEATDEDLARIQALLQEAAPLMLKPNDLPKSEFLSRYNILVYLISTLNADQLKHLTSTIEIAKSSKNLAKSNMWLVYRDAVAQADSFAAFHEIKSWILNKKVESDIAGELLATITTSVPLRYPELNPEVLSLAFDPVVMQQQLLNTSAILAATKFARLANDSVFIVENVIPLLSTELKQAIQSGDSKNAMVYIKALGNLAHPEILKVYVPYIVGSIPTSKFLRLQIVLSLKPLANLGNEKVRAVLYSILKNTAEETNVRVAAVLNIFLTFPTAEMMEVMAQMSNYDPSTEVRAVIATSIEFAAALKDPRFAELAKLAQSVSGIVTKNKHGYRLSTNSLMDEYTSSEDLAHFREVSFIGSENSILPVYHRAALRWRGVGRTEEDWYTYSISDMGQFIDIFLRQHLGPDANPEFKFSAKDLMEKLNIKQSHVPLEGSWYVDSMNIQELYTFTEDDLKMNIFKELYSDAFLSDVEKGVPVLYSKLGFQNEVRVSFPLISGMPFLFQYTEPYGIFVNYSSGKDSMTNFHQDFEFTYSRNLDSIAGFFDAFNNVFLTSGVLNKLQIHVPVKHATSFEKPISVKYELPEEDTTFIHFSVWPYTTALMTSKLQPSAENPKTKLVLRPKLPTDLRLEIGQQVGAVLSLEATSYSSDYESYYKIFSSDILTNVRNLLFQKDVAMTKFEIKYLAKYSTSKSVTFNFFYDKLYHQHEASEWGPPSPVEDLAPVSEVRRKEIIRRAAAGIPHAKVSVLDISASFQGNNPSSDVLFTAAFADSFIDNKVQASLFLHLKEQINAVFKLVKPKVQVLDVTKALKNDINVSYEGYWKYGSNSDVHFEGVGVRSKLYTEKLLNSSFAHSCFKNNANNNFYQADCHKMIILAHTPDRWNATVKYDALARYGKEANLHLNLMQVLLSPEFEVFIPSYSDKGTMEWEATFLFDELSMDFNDKTPEGTFVFKNINSLFYYPYALSMYAPTTSWERARNMFTNFQHLPFCSIDNNMIKTFSGRGYNYELTSSWHIAMLDHSSNRAKPDLVLLTRRPGPNQAEVYISYNSPSGTYLELEMKPGSVVPNTNAVLLMEGALTSYWNNITEAPFFEYYSIDDATVLDIENGAIRVVYDKERVVIFTDYHRNSTYGICGHNSMDVADDYMTPWGWVASPELYGASYSLTTEVNDPKTEKLKEEAKKVAVEKVVKFTWIDANHL